MIHDTIILRARAVTGRRCPQWGGGRLFGASTKFFFTKTAITRERKVEKSLPIWEMNLLSEGYQRAVDQNWGHMANIGYLGQKRRFWAQKKRSLLAGHDVLATTGKSCSKKKVPFSKIDISLFKKFGCFFG